MGVAPELAIADVIIPAYHPERDAVQERGMPVSETDGERPQFSDREALLFHSARRPGKIEIIASKPMATQRDLSLAYSPGVAVPVRAIHEDPAAAYDYTAKGNLVAVISNGTAILGLDNLGHMASKPVMEGKSVLFKRFADVDSFDIEVKTTDPDEFITVVKNIGDTWGGMAALAGSWIGGGANMLAMKEIFDVDATTFGQFAVVDVGVGYAWMAVLIYLAGKAGAIDARSGADVAALDDLKQRNVVLYRTLADDVFTSSRLQATLVRELKRMAPFVDYLCAALDLEF